MKTLAIGLFAAACTWSAQWSVRSDVPYHVYGHAAATLDGKIHILGGCHTEDWQIPSTEHQVYDPALDRWERKADLPLGVGWAMPAVWDGKIFVFGGGYHKPGPGMTSTAGAWVYDPATDKWKAIRSLPEPRMNGFAAALGKYIYISLGYDRQGGADDGVRTEFRSTYRYDPSADTYTRVADAPEPGCYIASGPYNNRIYAVPGSNREYGFHQDYAWADGALVYDPAADRWEKINAARIEKRVFFLTQCSSSAISEGKVWIVGGMGDKRTRTVKTEYFDIEKRAFFRGPDIEYGRCCGGGGIANGTLAIIGGFVDGKGLGTPALPTWTLDTKVAAAQIPADRWLEIDLYWFDRDRISESVRSFWDRYEPLYRGVTGWKGLIMSIGLSAGYILDWHGSLDERISLPRNMHPWPMLKCDRQLTGDTNERIRQWKEQRLATADKTAWASYQPWTYRDLRRLAEELRGEARKRGVAGFKVGSYVTGWDSHYSSKPIEFSVRHPNSYFNVKVNGRVFNHLALLEKDARAYGAYPDGIPQGTPVVEFFGRQWGSLSKTCGLDAILMKDAFFQPEAYQKAGPYGWTAPSDPKRVEEWHQATARLVRVSKQSNPAALVIGQSSAASAIADWRVECLDLERLAKEGYMDAYMDQTWSGAYAETGVRHVRFWNVPWLGWTHGMSTVLMHAAMLADTKVRHYVLTETFDAWEEFDILHNSPERLKWGIWAYLHAAIKTPGGLKMPAGSYISWANRGKALIPEKDVAWLAKEINGATLDARDTLEVPGATLVYSKSAMDWQSQNQPGRWIKEWIDEQAGTVMKWPVPIFSATRLEWLPKVSSDLFVIQTPAHVTPAEEKAVLGLMEAKRPVAIFASPAGGMTPAIAKAAGLESQDKDAGPLYKQAVATEDEYARGIPRRFAILHYGSQNVAATGARVLYRVENSPALILNGRVLVWDPAELIPDFPWVDKPFADFIGSPYAYVLTARAMNGLLKGTGSPHVEEVDPGQAVSVGYWKLRDGTYRMLAGNLEEGLRHDADFNRRVTVVFPQSWGALIRLTDDWHPAGAEAVNGKYTLALRQAECKLYSLR